jgi:hypothetical protein
VEGLRHRIQLAIDMASWPGVEIIAAQLVLDVFKP